jgi:hypothetical protein
VLNYLAAWLTVFTLSPLVVLMMYPLWFLGLLAGAVFAAFEIWTFYPFGRYRNVVSVVVPLLGFWIGCMMVVESYGFPPHGTR